MSAQEATLQFGSSGGLLVGSATGSATIGIAVDSRAVTAGTTGAAELFLQTSNAANTVTVNSTITNNAGAGAVAVTVSGPGRVVLAGTNTFTGAVTILSGALEVQNSSGLGTTAGGVTVNSGGALELSNGVTIGAEALTLNGTGTGTAGALRNISGNNSYGGTITVNCTSTIGSTAGTLTLGGAINAGGNSFTFSGVGNFIVNGIITQGSTANPTITKNGTGTLTLNGADALTGTGDLD